MCVALAAAFGLSATGARASNLVPSLRFNPPVATPVELGRETRNTIKESPHSTLEAGRALLMANTIASQIPGAKVFTVLPTGSMRPMFDEKAFVVVEPADYDDLRIGDIVTYEHPRMRTVIVHRILERTEDGYWTKGDFNDRPDDVYVTRSNYRMRVFAIIYAKENANASRGNVDDRFRASAAKVTR